MKRTGLIIFILSSICQLVAQFFSATPLIVGHKTRKGDLDSGVVYKRHGLSSITPLSFQSIVTEDKMPKQFVYPPSHFFNLPFIAEPMNPAQCFDNIFVKPLNQRPIVKIIKGMI